MITDVAGQKTAIERMMGVNGITVSWLPLGDNQPRTDMVKKVVYLPQLPNFPTAKDLVTWRGYVWHEVGHHHASQEALTSLMNRQNISFGSPLGLVINGLDDYWQETISVRNWGGAVANDFDVMHYDICMKAFNADPAMLDQKAMAALSVAQAARAAWADRLCTIIPQFTALCEDWPRISVCVPELEALVDMEPDDAAGELVRIARFILDIDPDDDSQSQTEPDQGEDKSGDPDSEGEEGSSPAEKIGYDELMHHVHSDEMGDAIANQRTEIVYDHEPNADYDPYPQHEIKVGKPTDMHSVGSTGSCPDAFINLYNQSKGVSKAISRLFQSQKQTKLLVNQKKGRPFRGLARVKSDPKNAKPFFKRINALSGKADVYLLVDCSGSMAGDPYEAASVAAIHLAEALTTGGIPVRVCGFTEQYEECIHYVFKDWREPVNAERMIEEFKTARLSMNADGDSLMQAYREIVRHKSGSTRQILIVLSDGSPSCNRSGDAYTYLQGVVKQLEREIEVYGVGLQTDIVKSFYKNYLVIDSPDEIEHKLVELVKKTILEK